MRYRLRTLLIVLALGPPALAAGWAAYREHQRREFIRLNSPPAVARIIITSDDTVTLELPLPE